MDIKNYNQYFYCQLETCCILFLCRDPEVRIRVKFSNGHFRMTITTGLSFAVLIPACSCLCLYRIGLLRFITSGSAEVDFVIQDLTECSATLNVYISFIHSYRFLMVPYVSLYGVTTLTCT